MLPAAWHNSLTQIGGWLKRQGADINTMYFVVPLAVAARYNVDKEAARVALDALMEDKAFRAAVVEEVSS